MGGEQEPGEALAAGFGAAPRRKALRRLLAGGTAGNSLLTTATGALLLVLLAALGVTIVAVHSLIDEHLFIGMLLLGPLSLKLASVGYRLTLYQTANARYRARGAPEAVMLALAPLVVLSTLILFASGVVLLLAGPSSRALWNPIHKYSFIVWLAVWWGHVIVHLPDLPKLLSERRSERERPWDDHGSGRGGRALALAGALVLGVVLAIICIPLFAAWSHWLSPVAH
ncbi:MAG TPA: hypothetical protein VHM72_01230 [Solirubrobacteraceae bacterium]|nr:hypothetical protein [Solirubrobacteraceae bacterium]